MDKSLDRQPTQKLPTAPPIRPSAERPLQLRDATFQRHFGVFLIGVCVLGCMLVTLLSWLSATREQNQVRRLQQLGITTEAEVISRTDIGHGTDRLTYRFSVVSLAGVRRSQVNTTTVERPRQPPSIPYRITVVYDPDDPRVSRLSNDNQPLAGVIARIFPFLWLGWLPLLAGTVILIRARSREELAQQLDQRGQIASGVVVERWHAQGQARGQSGGPCLTYQFDIQLPDGQTRRIIKAEIVDRVTRFQRAQVGTSVQVRYLPTDPNVCRIEWS